MTVRELIDRLLKMPPEAIDDRLGEALRRLRFGLIRPLWAEMDDTHRDYWRRSAARWRETILKDVGLKAEIEG